MSEETQVIMSNSSSTSPERQPTLTELTVPPLAELLALTPSEREQALAALRPVTELTVAPSAQSGSAGAQAT